MHGWDFSALEGRMTSEESDWDFEAECRDALGALADAGGGTVLDMGTGGGERLAALLDSLDAGRRDRLDVVATEGWERNVPAARERLEPLGVRVEEHDPGRGDPLPLPDGGVRLVMNRHEALDARDLARVLAPGGLLVCQQVDGTEVPEVHDWFGTRPAYPDVRPAVMADALRGAGLDVEETEQWSGPMDFADVDALGPGPLGRPGGLHRARLCRGAGAHPSGVRRGAGAADGPPLPPPGPPPALTTASESTGRAPAPGCRAPARVLPGRRRHYAPARPAHRPGRLRQSTESERCPGAPSGPTASRRRSSASSTPQPSQARPRAASSSSGW